MIKAVIFDMYEPLITHYECPLYFSAEMAKDAGISEENFRKIWRETEAKRTIGKISFEEVLEWILKENNSYSEEKLRYIAAKRIHTKEELFCHLHKEIIPLLSALKERKIQIGLISNCFSEEAKVIKKSILYPYFDVPLLSYDEGLQKPDAAIFERCLERLQVFPQECLYVGDGGSFELEAAENMGMKAVQAVWYVAQRKAEFQQTESPLELLRLL